MVSVSKGDEAMYLRLSPFNWRVKGLSELQMVRHRSVRQKANLNQLSLSKTRVMQSLD